MRGFRAKGVRWALGLLLAGCAGTPTAAPRATGARPGASTKAPASLGGGGPATGAAGVITNNGSNVIAAGSGNMVPSPPNSLPPIAGAQAPAQPAAGGLTGHVRAPAGVLANNGGNLVANNGGNVVANNGGSYRLRDVPSEVAAVGLVVRLLDGAGRPVTSADGQPLTSTTDATGAYRFPLTRIPNNWVVEAELPGGQGRLSALALRSDALTGGTAAADLPPVDLDTVSSLATTYVRDRYVATQLDRQATLDRLPASEELKTRQRTADALAAGKLAAPIDFAPVKLASTVDELRRSNAALDGQLEAVRKLLIVAGLTDLGAGGKALDAVLGDVAGMAVGPDGLLYVNSSEHGRIWRLEPDGTLATAVGSGSASAASLDGVAAAEAGLREPERTFFDAQGRLVIQERDRLSRLGTDGRMTELWRLPPAPALGLATFFVFAAPRPDGSVIAVSADGKAVTFTSVVAGQAPKTLATWPQGTKAPPAASGLASWRFLPPHQLAVQADGTLVLGSRTYVEGAERIERVRFDPGTLTFKAIQDDPVLTCIALDPTGLPLLFDPKTRRVEWVLADGKHEPIMDKLPDDFESWLGALRTPQGKTYLAFDRRVYEVQGGQAVAVIGTATGGGASAGGVALKVPSGVAANAAGDVFVVEAEFEDNKLLRAPRDGVASVFLGPDAAVEGLSAVGIDGQGRLYLPADDRLLRVDPAAAMPAFAPYCDLAAASLDGAPWVARHVMTTFAVAPDGSAYMGYEEGETSSRTRIVRLAPGAAGFTTVTVGDRAFAYFGLACDAQGGLFLAGFGDESGPAITGKLQRWTAAGGLKLVKQDAQLPWGGANIAVDPRGRVTFVQSSLYGGDFADRIWRYDPVKDAFTAIAGPGGFAFQGHRVDDSIAAPAYPAYDGAGDLVFADTGHQQIKRVPAAQLE